MPYIAMMDYYVLQESAIPYATGIFVFLALVTVVQPSLNR